MAEDKKKVEKKKPVKKTGKFKILNLMVELYIEIILEII